MTIHDSIKKAAIADVFAMMANENESKKTIEFIRSMSDYEIDALGKLSNIPDKHLMTFRSIMRGEDCAFFEQMRSFTDKLTTGDIILVTGKSYTSQALVKLQKPVYANAKSSHIVIVHADFICVDAIPDIGVSNRLVNDVLNDVEPDWRVIRHNEINDSHIEYLQKKCAYYIAQPYKITLQRKKGKDYSYCSELARKIFEGCNISNTGIPAHSLIKPCDFDRIADSENSGWSDVTESVRSYIEFSIENSPILENISKLFIEGLKLNRSRYEERRQTLRRIEATAKKGKIKPEAATKAREYYAAMENSMNFAFWDFKKISVKSQKDETHPEQ